MKNKKEVGYGIVLLLVLVISVVSVGLASAGVGLKWDSEGKIVEQGQKSCLTYSVYNPWPKESYATISVSDELKDILQSQESETKLIPADTLSTKAIPVKFCFTIPYVYSEGRDCLIGNYLCKQTCTGEQKIYSGEVLLTESAGGEVSGGSGGSSTSVSVSAPLNLRVSCNAHSRDFALVYIIVAILALLAIIVLLLRRYRMPKVERDKEKLRRLKEEVRRESREK